MVPGMLHLLEGRNAGFSHSGRWKRKKGFSSCTELLNKSNPIYNGGALMTYVSFKRPEFCRGHIQTIADIKLNHQKNFSN
jgi:hypothetical protein